MAVLFAGKHRFVNILIRKPRKDNPALWHKLQRCPENIVSDDGFLALRILGYAAEIDATPTMGDFIAPSPASDVVVPKVGSIASRTDSSIVLPS
jgi:hypothetical protein